jgi:hypothetical protein
VETHAPLNSGFGMNSKEALSWVSDSAQVAALLSKWRGATAQSWSYTASHSQLIVRVQRVSDPVDLFSLFLLFKGCSSVSFQDMWQSFDLKIDGFAGESGPAFLARDGDRLHVRFRYGPFACETSDFLKLHGI